MSDKTKSHHPQFVRFPALLVASLLSTGAAPLGLAAPALDQARIEAVAAMLPGKATGVGRPIADRAAWMALGKPGGAPALIEEANKLRLEPLPATTDDLFLEYSRTGNRTHWQDLNNRRRARITTYVLAECLEDQGRFLPALTTALESICAEPTWVMPAHDGSLNNFHGKSIDIDLGSSNLGWILSTADWLVGERLDSATRQRVRARIEERILRPFEDMVTGKRSPNGWLTQTNNWNAVCLANVVGAALAEIDDPKTRALFIAAAERYSKYFVKSFTSDGYCSEGVGYWNYGFGHYLLLAETISQATDGRVDLLSSEAVREAALYGTRIEIVPGVCPAFADCAVDAVPSDRWLSYIRSKWNLPPASKSRDQLPWAAHSLMETGLFAFKSPAPQTQPAPESSPALAERTWFDQAGILIGRPGAHPACRLAVALKGGHNGENHNHNDVGSYVVVVGRQLMLVDPGSEVYTARTFSSHRYDSKVLNSFGHAVPRVAGELQQAGAQARGRVLLKEFTPDTDKLVLDIRSAYKVAELEKLERTFTYARSNSGALTVSDEVAFKSPQAFGTALVTFGKWRRLGPDRMRMEDGHEAVDVVISVTGGEIELSAEEIHEDLTARRLPTRIGLDFTQPVLRATISVSITPSGE